MRDVDLEPVAKSPQVLIGAPQTGAEPGPVRQTRWLLGSCTPGDFGHRSCSAKGRPPDMGLRRPPPRGPRLGRPTAEILLHAPLPSSTVPAISRENLRKIPPATLSRLRPPVEKRPPASATRKRVDEIPQFLQAQTHLLARRAGISTAVRPPARTSRPARAHSPPGRRRSLNPRHRANRPSPELRPPSPSPSTRASATTRPGRRRSPRA